MNCAAPHCPGLGQIWEQTFEWGERSGEKKVKTVKNCFFKKLAQDTHSGAIPRGWEMQLFPSHAQIPCRSLKEGSACIPTWGRGTAGVSEEENGQSQVFTGSFLLLFRQDFGQFNSFFPFFFSLWDWYLHYSSRTTLSWSFWLWILLLSPQITDKDTIWSTEPELASGHCFAELPHPCSSHLWPK